MRPVLPLPLRSHCKLTGNLTTNYMDVVHFATTIWTPPNTSQTPLFSLSLILPSCSSYFSLLPGARRSVPDGNSLRLQEPLGGHTEEGQAGNNQAQCSCLSGSL
ncbi:hypothetical protein ROHU_017900 [Labeo rohita]|uniref:Uncharacterized protein n=1 Tax=Labeo rohita TaxID=84645 RepID=A0A498ND84_LABRO|nr:hypothetical protein ROHU_017900 [Labeo rohita]